MYRLPLRASTLVWEEMRDLKGLPPSCKDKLGCWVQKNRLGMNTIFFIEMLMVSNLRYSIRNLVYLENKPFVVRLKAVHYNIYCTLHRIEITSHRKAVKLDCAVIKEKLFTQTVTS